MTTCPDCLLERGVADHDSELYKLNSNIEVDSVPLPDLHSAFDWFSEAKYFTVIDLNAAYHQIPLSKESRPLLLIVGSMIRILN